MRRCTKYSKGKKPPVFISSLYQILSQSSNYSYIKWTDDEQSFVILNISKFSEIILPKYYKHSNYSSFVRQLNMYNFNKQRSDLQGEHIFKNQLFFKNNQDNLKFIKRREVITNKDKNIYNNNNNNNNSNNNNNNNNNNTSILPLQLSISRAHANNLQFIKKNNVNEYESISQENSSSKADKLMQMQIAAPSQNHINLNFFVDNPRYDNLGINNSLDEYMIQTQNNYNNNSLKISIPPIIPLGYQPLIPHSQRIQNQPLKLMIDKIKQNQLQLQAISLGLFQQNQFLINQNSRLQQKLRTQYRKKQQIITQIIKYVINFLNQWKQTLSEISKNKQNNNDCENQENYQSSEDIILESYDKIQKKYNNRQTQDKYKFTQYAQNQKKILLTLLKQIQKSYNYNERSIFGHNINKNISQKIQSNSSQFPYQHINNPKSTSQFSNSPNSFLMSMLLKFIQSNNLSSVIQRFSMLLNLQRNKKSKNYTIVNCMNDLKQHFFGQNTRKKGYNFDNNNIDKLCSSQFDKQKVCSQFFDNEKQSLFYNHNNNYLQSEQYSSLSLSMQMQDNNNNNMQLDLDKQKYLENQKYTINQMQKQLELALFNNDFGNKKQFNMNFIRNYRNQYQENQDEQDEQDEQEGMFQQQ